MSKVRSNLDYDDWVDIADSEFVDFVEGRSTVGFVFEHEEIGLHGIKFDPETGVMDAVIYERVANAGKED